MRGVAAAALHPSATALRCMLCFSPHQELPCDVTILATDWFLCLFSTSAPSEVVMRIWDALFNEGSKILYRCALALLQLHEHQLLKLDNAGELRGSVGTPWGRIGGVGELAVACWYCRRCVRCCDCWPGGHWRVRFWLHGVPVINMGRQHWHTC